MGSFNITDQSAAALTHLPDASISKRYTWVTLASLSITTHIIHTWHDVTTVQNSADGFLHTTIVCMFLFNATSYWLPEPQLQTSVGSVDPASSLQKLPLPNPPSFNNGSGHTHLSRQPVLEDGSLILVLRSWTVMMTVSSCIIIIITDRAERIRRRFCQRGCSVGFTNEAR